MSDFTHDGTGTTAAAWRDDARWQRSAPLDLGGVRRVLVVAAHPDDESLGAGGLLATAHDLGLPVHLVSVTAGEHSHPGSPTHDPATLADRRRVEAREALDVLAPDAAQTWLGVEDGRVAEHVDDVVRVLVGLVGDGAGTLLLAPWRRDGHPDHDAVGQAAATAADRCGATLWEYPVWFWHWGDPARPWPVLGRLALAPAARARKAAAVAAHRSQVEPLSDRPGDERLLGPGFLAHFGGAEEAYVREAVDDRALDDLHRAREDPWGVDVRWYEERKRRLTLAALPRARFRRGLEVGCSVGALSERLAERCDALVAVDRSAAALARAAARGLGPSVETVLLDVGGPEAGSWPPGRFDLVVLSEVGYFLSPGSLRRVVERVRACLDDDGVVVLCHWLHPVVGWPLDGPGVHDIVRTAGLRPVQLELRERDVELLVLAADDVWPEPTT